MSDVGTTARKLTPRDKLRIWERDKGVCQCCHRQLRAGDEWICEHLRALELGGTNEDANLAVYCIGCAHEKTRVDHSQAAKAKRRKQAALGIKPEGARKLEGPGFRKFARPSRVGKARIDKSALPPLPRRGVTP